MASDRTVWAEPLMSNLKRYPVLDRDEEQRLAIAYRDTRDPAAERRLVEGHLWLVVRIARSCCFRPSTLPDMIQEGVLGLMKAVRKYDPDRGVRLSTYATWWIRAYLYQYVMVNARIMRMVTTLPQRKLFFALRREQAKLGASGDPAEPAVLARQLGVPVDDVIEMEARLGAKDVPLDPSGVELEGQQELRHDGAGADEVVLSRELQRTIRERMEVFEATLGERERLIFEQRLAADEPMTLQEVGRKFGISRERVRQLEQRLKRKLQLQLKAVGISNLTDLADNENASAGHASATPRRAAA